MASASRAAAQRQLELLSEAGDIIDLVLRITKCTRQQIGPPAEVPLATFDAVYDLNLPRCNHCELTSATPTGLKRHKQTCRRRDSPTLTIPKDTVNDWAITRAFGSRAHRWYALRHAGTPTPATWNIGAGSAPTLVRHADIDGDGGRTLIARFWRQEQQALWRSQGSPTNDQGEADLPTLDTVRRSDYRRPIDQHRCRWCALDLSQHPPPHFQTPPEAHTGRADARQWTSPYVLADTTEAHHHQCPEEPPVVARYCAVQRVYIDAMVKADRARRNGIALGDVPLKSAMTATVLGRRQRADGTDKEETTARLATARARMKTLRPIWTAKELTGKQKLTVYRAVIVSTITYGCEAWDLQDNIVKSLRHFNDFWFHKVIVANTPIDKRPPHFTFNLVGHVHLTRLHWLGHLWRMETTSPEPRAPFRAMLTDIRHASDIRPRLHTGATADSIQDAEYGADPATVDFDLDTTTFRAGSLYELVPPQRTFAELRSLFLGADSSARTTGLRKRWQTMAMKIVKTHYPDLGY